MVVTLQDLAPLQELERRRAELLGILCLTEERTVTRDNCVSYRGRSLQLPLAHGRQHVKGWVRVHEHADGTLSVSLDGGARETAMRTSDSRHPESP